MKGINVEKRGEIKFARFGGMKTIEGASKVRGWGRAVRRGSRCGGEKEAGRSPHVGGAGGAHLEVFGGCDIPNVLRTVFLCGHTPDRAGSRLHTGGNKHVHPQILETSEAHTPKQDTFGNKTNRSTKAGSNSMGTRKFRPWHSGARNHVNEKSLI